MHKKRIREYAGRLLAFEEEMNRISNSKNAVDLGGRESGDG
jgi:hypothetical protein